MAVETENESRERVCLSVLAQGPRSLSLPLFGMRPARLLLGDDRNDALGCDDTIRSNSRCQGAASGGGQLRVDMAKMRRCELLSESKCV